MTKKEAFKEINETQRFYVGKLVEKINEGDADCLKTINFTSPTGTGKTNMMALLCDSIPEAHFIITTLSRGQLNKQVERNMEKLCKTGNFTVYGLCDYKSNSKMTAKDILSLLPEGKDVIWLRDEGHINTNKWQGLLEAQCRKIVNFSATNKTSVGIRCNFTNTMMLRTVEQAAGTPEDAIEKLIEVKKAHSSVKGYNPCAIMRCLDDSLTEEIERLCDRKKLKWIDITGKDCDMEALCRDDCEYDVIINKFKITEGIDIRRAHVLYMTNEPANAATTIQAIGRCRRNALLYRDDVDILAKGNEALLDSTRRCYVYYNIKGMKTDTDENGELCAAFCDRVSCQELKADSEISVKDGQMANGLRVIELDGETGTYRVEEDPATGFNVIKPEGKFYADETKKLTNDNSIEFKEFKDLFGTREPRLSKKFIKEHFGKVERKEFDYSTGEYVAVGVDYVPFRKESFQFRPSEAEAKAIAGAFEKKRAEAIAAIKAAMEALSSAPAESFVKGITAFIPNIAFPGASIDINPESVKRYGETGDPLEFVRTDDLFCRPPLLRAWSANPLTHVFQKEEGFEAFGKTEAEVTKKAEAMVSEMLAALKESLRKEESGENSFCSCDLSCRVCGAEEILGLKRARGYYSQTNLPDADAAAKAVLSASGEYAVIVDVFRDEVWKENVNGWVDRALKEKRVHDYQLDDPYFPAVRKWNDRESAIVGTDLMKTLRDDSGKALWVEDRSVASKSAKWCKLTRFIYSRYAKQFEEAKGQLFSGKSDFPFDKKANSCLGYCVEYYSKYLVYGERYLGDWIEEAMKEARADKPNDMLVVRACMLKYRGLMERAFGKKVAKLVVKTISAQQLIRDKYAEFVCTVVELGRKTAEFVRAKMGIAGPLGPGDRLHDPNLSVKHIAALADYIDRDTIIDVKATGRITEAHVMQVLSYAYLSTKRSDLSIKRAIVYDAVSGRSGTRFARARIGGQSGKKWET